MKISVSHLEKSSDVIADAVVSTCEDILTRTWKIQC